MYVNSEEVSKVKSSFLRGTFLHVAFESQIWYSLAREKGERERLAKSDARAKGEKKRKWNARARMYVQCTCTYNVQYVRT